MLSCRMAPRIPSASCWLGLQASARSIGAWPFPEPLTCPLASGVPLLCSWCDLGVLLWRPGWKAEAIRCTSSRVGAKDLARLGVAPGGPFHFQRYGLRQSCCAVNQPACNPQIADHRHLPIFGDSSCGSSASAHFPCLAIFSYAHTCCGDRCIVRPIGVPPPGGIFSFSAHAICRPRR